MSTLSAESVAATAAVNRSTQRLVLRPKVGWQPIDLAELWRYRELLWILAMRDIKVRYKQTVLGAAWALIQPFFQMVIFTILFAHNGFPTEGVPGPVFYFAGLLPWQLFATSLTNAGNSLITNQNLITKVYFPRLVIPIAAVMTGLLDFAISFVFLILLMAWYHVHPSPAVFLLPIFIALAFLAALAAGLWLSALNVEFRDVRYVIPFLVQFWLFISAVITPSSMVTTPWKRALLGVNPMTGVIEGFRWCVYGRPTPGPMLAVSAVSILVVLVGGLFYFRRMEKTFADLV